MAATHIHPTAWTPGLAVAAVAGLVILLAGGAVDLVAALRVRREPPDWNRLFARIRARPWEWQEGGAILLILGILQLVLLFVTQATGLAFEPSEDLLVAASAIGQTLLFHGVGCAIVLWSLRLRRIGLREAFGSGGDGLGAQAGFALRFFLGAMPFVVAASLVSAGVLRVLGLPVEPQPVITILTESRYSPWLQGYLAALAVGVAPVVEEILFRGIALPLALKHLGPGPAMVAVSLLFAAVHFHLPSVLPLFAIATALSLAYVRTGSLLVPILAHAMFNGTQIAFLHLLKGAEWF